MVEMWGYLIFAFAALSGLLMLIGAIVIIACALRDN